MRRTVFAVPVEDAAVIQAAAATGVARVERRRTEALVAQLGIANADGWLREVEAAAVAAIDQHGEVTAQELARLVPPLAARVRLNPGQRYEGEVSMASRVLLTLAVEGRLVRARPLGTWRSSQYRWTPMARWLGAPLAPIPAADAQAGLVRRWLARFGPGTEADVRWWTGWTAREVRAALVAAGAVTVALEDGEPAHVLSDDLEPVADPDAWVALLPPLDPTTMGWTRRDWYLGPHRAALFDTAGNAGPTIWADGRIVGGLGRPPVGRGRHAVARRRRSRGDGRRGGRAGPAQRLDRRDGRGAAVRDPARPGARGGASLTAVWRPAHPPIG